MAASSSSVMSAGPRVVLLLCDLQNDIVGSLPDAIRAPLLRQCSKLLQAARARGWRVVHSGVCADPATAP